MLARHVVRGLEDVAERRPAQHQPPPVRVDYLIRQVGPAAGSDFIFVYGAEEPPPPALVSDVKIRDAGFTEVMDTEETFRYWLGLLMERRVLPP
jgi:hypothetical protein